MNNSNPESVFGGLFTWDYWTITRLHEDFNTLIVGNIAYNVVVLKEEIESDYPGFITSFTALSTLGCSEDFITKLLKFCIVNAQGRNMFDVLHEFELLQKVESAIALELSADELLALVGQFNKTGPLFILPESMI